MSSTLLAITTFLEGHAGASTSANTSAPGYWKRIAAALETLAGASTTANPGVPGYMLRAALAAESIAGTSGAEENASEAGYAKRIADALEVQSGAVTAGSYLQRMMVAAENAVFGGGGGELFPQTDLVGMQWNLLGGWSYNDVTGVLNPNDSGGQTWITSAHGETLRDALTPGLTYLVVATGVGAGSQTVKLRGGVAAGINPVTDSASVVCGSSTDAVDAIILEDTEGTNYNITDISVTAV